MPSTLPDRGLRRMFTVKLGERHVVITIGDIGRMQQVNCAIVKKDKGIVHIVRVRQQLRIRDQSAV